RTATTGRHTPSSRTAYESRIALWAIARIGRLRDDGRECVGITEVEILRLARCGRPFIRRAPGFRPHREVFDRRRFNARLDTAQVLIEEFLNVIARIGPVVALGVRARVTEVRVKPRSDLEPAARGAGRRELAILSPATAAVEHP